MLEQVDFGPSSGVPRLVGWCPQISLVVYHRADGRPLDRLSTSDILAGIRAAGRWLAALHDSRLVVDRQLDWYEELTNVGLWADRVASARPSRAAEARRLAAGLVAASGGLRTSNDVPIHKDFHYRHVIAAERTVALDFDEFRMGVRDFDVAHFCTYLRLLELRGRAPAPIGDLQRVFVDAYAKASGWTAQPDVRIFSAYTCLKIAKQLSSGSGVAPHPRGARLEQELEAVLGHGLALIDSVCNGGWS
jgi:aminoglycoside phosphotransferase (APT) family kinase protein